MANQPYTEGKVRAYVNWILFDEQFRFVPESSGAELVHGSEEFFLHVIDNLPVTKSGYLYVYTSNQTTGIDVFFDNLQVTHIRGPLVEETHYYPFGLLMAGISSKALAFGQPENKKKYQQYEFNSDFDLNLYESFYRTHDPQLGRFWQIDPTPTHFESLYAAMGNNPVRNTDFLGDRRVNFDENGNFINITKDNWWHNLWRGTNGRVLDKDGNVKIKFKFGDTKHDVADIKAGIINKLVFVKDNEIKDMVRNSGAFSSNHKFKNVGFEYINSEGKAGKRMDYSYRQIPDKYPGEASHDPLNVKTPTRVLFLVQGLQTSTSAGAFDTRDLPTENIAFNHLNFGNFLFGAGAAAIGISAETAQLGGQKNSIVGRENGYGPQLDSSDDQFAIKVGHMYGIGQGYDRISMTSKVIFP